MADTDFWNKDFPIACMTRADLVSAGFSQEQVTSLTDEDMQEIAQAMADIYCDCGYWEDLELCTNRVLEARKEEQPDGLPGLEQEVRGIEHQ